ncbi:hypothetical protein Q7P35_007864 [Cladosporium inversicolor]
MQRARCCAANAYDATAAFHAVFGRAPTPRHLRRLSSVRNELYSQGHGGRRSYSSDAENARQRELGGPTEDALTPYARKLAFYEELMAPTKTPERENRDRKPAVHRTLEKRERTRRPPENESKEQESLPTEEEVDLGPWDARPGLSLLGEPLWRTKMMELSQHIRDSKLAKSQKSPESEDGPESPTTLDYKGVAIRPQISKVYPRRRPPWTTVRDEKTAGYTAAQILDAEIRAFDKHMSPTDEEQAARDSVRRNIRAVIQSDPDNREVNNYHFGSTKTGLAMPFSDVDLGVYHSSTHWDNLEQFMERLYQNLLNGKDYMLVVHRPPPNAIITAQHKVTGIDVQVIAKGLPGKQDKFMETYLRTIPNFRELYAVVRTAFGTRGLVDPFIGGISAYGTSIMLVAALTRRKTPPELRKPESISAQLLYFLSFWATFDTTKYGISFSNPATAKIFNKTPPDASRADKEARLKVMNTARSKGDFLLAGQMRIGRLREEQPYLMCLQDPSNPVNDLGARCHAFKHIQETIKVMHAELVRSMEEYDQANPDSKLRNGEPRESLLTPLVGRCHELYAERRERMVARKLKTLPAGVQFRRVMGDSPESFREDLPPRGELSAGYNAKTRKWVMAAKAARRKK